MLTEQEITLVDGVDENGNIRIKKVTRVLKDGVQYGPDMPHRRVIAPGDDISGEQPHVVAMTLAVWTPEKVQARTQAMVDAIAAQVAAKQAAVAELQREIDNESRKRADLDVLRGKLVQ